MALIIDAGVCDADVPALSRRLAELLRREPAANVLCDVSALDRPDWQAVHVLARLQMGARALGGAIWLCNVQPRLRELLDFAGLSTVLPCLEDAVQFRDIGKPKRGNSASVSRNAVNSAICPPKNSST